jgi:prepilin-type N-terminal cleavage/methylation domain-containing protein
MSRAPKRSAHHRGSQSGFTLIELFIALAVFSVGVLTMAVIIPSGARKSDNSGQQSRASEFAAARAEELLDVSYTDDNLTAGTHTDDANPFLNQYYVEWVVEADQPIANCKRVTIKVHQGSLSNPTAAQLVILKVLTDS